MAEKNHLLVCLYEHFLTSQTSLFPTYRKPLIRAESVRHLSELSQIQIVCFLNVLLFTIHSLLEGRSLISKKRKLFN